MKLKQKNVYGDFSENKQKIDFNNYFVQSKYYDDSDVLVIRIMKQKSQKRNL